MTNLEVVAVRRKSHRCRTVLNMFKISADSASMSWDVVRDREKSQTKSYSVPLKIMDIRRSHPCLEMSQERIKTVWGP